MDFKLIQDGAERGDCTAPYKVIIRENGTVNDFIDAVINNHPRDWGYIGIKEKGYIFGHPNMEYSRGKTTNREALEAFKDLSIKSVTADGGWSRMDYLIET